MELQLHLLRKLHGEQLFNESMEQENAKVLKEMAELKKLMDNFCTEVSGLCEKTVNTEMLQTFWNNSEEALKKVLVGEVKELVRKLSATPVKSAAATTELLDVKLLALMHTVIQRELEEQPMFRDMASQKQFKSKTDGTLISIFNRETGKVCDLTQVDDFIVFQLAAQILFQHNEYSGQDLRHLQSKLETMKDTLADMERRNQILQSELDLEKKRAQASSSLKREREQEQGVFTYERLNKIRSEQTEKMKKVLHEHLVVPQNLPHEFIYPIDEVFGKLQKAVEDASRETHRQYFGLVNKN